MEITQATDATRAATGAAASTAAGTGDTGDQSSKVSDALSSDFETFLKMLTVQMENQDPLNPIKSEDFAMQLATFSGVEQQVRTNDLLTGIADGLSGGAMAELASWVGLDVRASIPVAFEGSPLTLYTEADAGADKAMLVVRDANGDVAQRLEFDPALREVTWAGTGEDGQPLANGSYQFSVDSYKDGELLGSSDVQSFARVAEARSKDGAVVLVTADGTEFAAEEVSAVRQGSQG